MHFSTPRHQLLRSVEESKPQSRADFFTPASHHEGTVSINHKFKCTDLVTHCPSRHSSYFRISPVSGDGILLGRDELEQALQVKGARRARTRRGALWRRSCVWPEGSGREAREGGQAQETATSHRFKRMLWALGSHRRLWSRQWPDGRCASAGAGLGNRGRGVGKVCFCISFSAST